MSPTESTIDLEETRNFVAINYDVRPIIYILKKYEKEFEILNYAIIIYGVIAILFGSIHTIIYLYILAHNILRTENIIMLTTSEFILIVFILKIVKIFKIKMIIGVVSLLLISTFIS